MYYSVDFIFNLTHSISYLFVLSSLFMYYLYVSQNNINWRIDDEVGRTHNFRFQFDKYNPSEETSMY